MSAVDPVISSIVAVGVALLFAAAALHKLRDWSRFRSALDDYRILPTWATAAAAPALVALEIAVAAMLPFAATRRAGALLAAALLACYALAIGINLQRGRTTIDCGCLGAGRRSRIGAWMVVRNLSIGAVTLAAALPTTGRGLAALDVVTISGAVLTLAALYAALEPLQRSTGSASWGQTP